MNRSGPRAKAFDTRRYSDHTAFVQTQTVRLAPDVARFFKTPEDVNNALRQVIALATLVKEKEAEAKANEAAAEGEEAAEAEEADAMEDAAADEVETAEVEAAGEAEQAPEQKAE